MFLKNLLSLFLKSNCPSCDRSAIDTFCEDCQKRLFAVRLNNPSQFWQGDIPLFVWGDHRGQLKRAIATCKYNNCPKIGAALGFWMGEAWRNSPLFAKYPKTIVVPIPLHKNKLALRGFNQAEVIAKSFCQVTNYTLKKDGISRVRETEAMFGLSPAARVENIQNAFSLGTDFQRNFPRSSVLLIDDIYTTGTTVKEVARILQKYQIDLIGIAAVSKPIKTNAKN
jgi:ComF family protein